MIIRNCNENEGILQALTDAGVLVNDEESFRQGHVTLHVRKVNVPPSPT